MTGSRLKRLIRRLQHFAHFQFVRIVRFFSKLMLSDEGSGAISPGWTRGQAGEWGCWGRIEMPNFSQMAIARSPVGHGVVAFVVWVERTTMLCRGCECVFALC